MLFLLGTFFLARLVVPALIISQGIPNLVLVMSVLSNSVCMLQVLEGEVRRVRWGRGGIIVRLGSIRELRYNFFSPEGGLYSTISLTDR